MDISFNGYQKINSLLRREYFAAIDEVMDLDSDTKVFNYQYKMEKRLGKVLGKGYAIGTSSGTAALQLSLAGLGIGPGDEVITSPLTFIATALAISNTGARPVFCDIDKETFLIDIGEIKKKISKKTKAIIPVHLFGQMSDMKKLKKEVSARRIHIIEDACQAHLARFDGKLPGTYSDATCYSFFPSKTFGGLSNGGMVLTRNRTLAKNLEVLRNPTSENVMVMKSMRTPCYLDATKLAVLMVKARYIYSFIEKKRMIAKDYSEGIRQDRFRMQKKDHRAYHTYRDFALVIENRDQLASYLSRRGIPTTVHYHPPIHLTKTFKNLGHKKGDFPNAEYISSRIISLPINPMLTKEEVNHIIREINSY